MAAKSPVNKLLVQMIVHVNDKDFVHRHIIGLL